MSGDPGDPAAERMLEAARRHYLPGAVIVASGKGSGPARGSLCSERACVFSETDPVKWVRILEREAGWRAIQEGTEPERPETRPER